MMKRGLLAVLFFAFHLLCLAEGRTEVSLPLSRFGKDMLFGSRIVSVNRPSGKVYAEGQMKEQPVLVRFSVIDDSTVCMRQVGYEAPDGSTWKTRIPKDSEVRFKVVGRSADSVTMDMTDYFSTYPEAVSLIPPSDLCGKAVYNKVGRPETRDGCIRIMASYGYGSGLEVCVSCFFLFLEDIPMPSRTITGYNGVEYRSAEGKRMKISHLWNIKRDSHIVFYVDRRFPEEWFPYIKEGIEDWNRAFESIGIHGLLSVYPEPESFDSTLPLVNMVRYIDVDVANAKGQVYVDPRSGEILQGDILWWRNVTELLEGWRYVQTGAADPQARLADYPIEMIGPMVRHAVSHEMGHVLGLNHNMGGSFAYPSDSLKSVSFTEKYGTTASVMDYARYNHLASADDVKAGVNLLPPRIGPYDMFAIASAYSDIPVEPGDYCFYSPFISAAISPDPSSQPETLGDDLLRSSSAGISNCVALLELDGLSPERLNLLKKQYYRYISLALSNLGGAVHGNPVPERRQKQTLGFIFDALQNVPPQLSDTISRDDIMKELTGNFIPQRIRETHGEKALGRYLRRVNRYSNIYQ